MQRSRKGGGGEFVIESELLSPTQGHLRERERREREKRERERERETE